MEKNNNKKADAQASALVPATPGKPSVIGALAARLECEPAKLLPMLKKTAFAACHTDEEFMAMCITANTYGLNPILKEIYAFPTKKGAVVPIVGVDGWNHLMNSNPAFDGIEFVETDDSCTAIIYRKDRKHPIKVTEWLAECMQDTEPWRRWPKRMLRHKATIQCARLAFGLVGIYDEDEARRMDDASAPAKQIPPEVKSNLRAALGIDKPVETVEAVAVEAVPVEAELNIDGVKQSVTANEAPKKGGDAIAADVQAVL